jgi:nucleoside-diphosphate-sugar epimerase
MKVVLVSGAAGFIGANLVRRLIADDYDVHAMVRPGSATWRLSGVAPVTLHEADIRDRDGLTRLVARIRPHWVLHCSAYGAYSWQTEVPRMGDTNQTGTVNLLQACLRAGFEVFVNTGSSSEYGYKDHAPSEDEAAEPNSDYALSKLRATEYCRSVARMHHVAVPTVRLYSVYGPLEEPRRLIPMLASAALCGQLPPLADPSAAHDFVHVADVCDAYLRVATSAAVTQDGIYNVGTGTQTTLAQLVDLVRSMVDVPVEPRWGSLEARAWDTCIWQADPAKIRTQLRWQPRALGDGLAGFIDWMRSHPEFHERYALRLPPAGEPQQS